MNRVIGIMPVENVISLIITYLFLIKYSKMPKTARYYIYYLILAELI